MVAPPLGRRGPFPSLIIVFGVNFGDLYMPLRTLIKLGTMEKEETGRKGANFVDKCDGQSKPRYSYSCVAYQPPKTYQEKPPLSLDRQ